ncbi:hypothetical protein DBR11_10325 [Pedobacter sp. HMWF019]|uniref:hypothetical protein n=1 Tax=Pedobacter sp. HMWF019 TaxID=2056856 RepID=UPI000D3DAD2C|nr:hypothetical protein [Pedobacter sp. HMWF019]PTT00220.1 hypothetical protein DBR11_10325 [Pedobacter sp. HMWF019]
MKLYKRIFATALLPLLFAACKKEEHSLGRVLDKSEIKFSVTQDKQADAGGNTVILKNMTPGTLPMWDYGIGSSTRMVDTVKFAFAGDYVIKLSVSTGGMVVKMDSVIIKVTQDNLNYVNDPLWTAISGGVGKDKQWVLDTEGKYFSGPLSFYGVNIGWLKEGGPWASGAFSTGCYGGDCWTWGPGISDIYPGIMAAGDYGVMTFGLKGTAAFQAVKPMEGNVTQNGTYFLSVNSKTLSINNASILRGYKPAKNGLTGISNWSNYKILSLDENTMQLGVIRDKDVDGEGPAMIVYNFLSKTFSDHYVPPVTGPDEGFDPTFKSGELLSMITGTTSGRLWKIDASGNPIDWIAKGKGWTKTSDDTRDWGWNNSWDLIAKNSWILFNRVGGMNYTRNQNGVMTTGTFTINEATNEVTLNGELLLQNPGNSLSPVKNTFKVVKVFPGKVESKGIWFGTDYNAAKDEWFSFHYIL